MRHILTVLIVGILTLRQEETRAPGQYSEFSSPSRIALEDATYTAALRSLKLSNLTEVANLIDRDPVMARLVLIRLLREPADRQFAGIFVELFPTASDSEIEVPFWELYQKLSTREQAPLLNWMETVSHAQFLVLRHYPSGRVAGDLLKARTFFKESGFRVGEAFSLRILAHKYSFDPGTPAYAQAQELFGEASGIYESIQNTRGQAHCLADLSVMYRNNHDRKGWEDSIRKALQKVRAAGDTIAELPLLLAYGNEEQLRQAWPALERAPGLRSLKYQYLSALFLADPKYPAILSSMLAEERDSILATKANWDLFNSLWGVRTETALEASGRAIRLASALPYDMAAYDDHSRAGAALPEMYYQQGAAEIDLYRPLQAEASFTAALDSWRAAGRPDFVPGEAGVLHTLAGAYSSAGEYPKAIEAANRSLSLDDRGQPHQLLGQIYGELGRLDQAEAEFLKASRMPTPQVNMSLVNLAEFHLRFGYYAKALKDIEDLDPEFDRFPNSAQRRAKFGPRLRVLAQAWMGIGDLDKAIQYAREFDAKESGPPEIGVLGTILIESERYSEAETYFRNRLNPTSSDPEIRVADAHKNLGRLYRLKNRRDEAISHLNEALELFRRMFRRTDEMELLIELGQVARQFGKPAEARGYFERALAMAKETRSPKAEWSARTGLAGIYREQGNTAAAIAELKLAVEAVEAVASRLNTDLTKSAFIENQVYVYDELIRLLGNTSPEQSFAYAERRRAQSFMEAMRRDGTLPYQNAGLSRQIQDVEARLVGKHKALIDLVSIPRPDAFYKAALSRELEAVQREHTELLRRAEQDYPSEAVRRGAGKPLTPNQVQHILKPSDALVEYIVTGNEVYAFVVTPDSVRIDRLPTTRNALAKDVQDLMKPFQQLQAGEVDQYHMQYDVKLANKLYANLVAPIETAIGRAQRLILVPDDVLNYLPFEILARSPRMGEKLPGMIYAEYRSVDWLINRYSVVYAVSATSLDPVSQRNTPKPNYLVAFGDPKLTNVQARALPATLRGAPVGPLMPSLAPLPAAAREATRVAQLLARNKVQTKVFIGAEARETEFSKEAPKAGYIHLAVHSMLYEQEPYYSTLFLAPGDQSDGWLQTFEIMRTPLNARLVTLSGCETGLGKLFRGEGLLGLRRAFLIAGAESVAVSYWSIEDSTADFMDVFYGNISQGQPLADALRNAKRQYSTGIKREGGWQVSMSHPFYWASFGLASTSIQ